MRIPPPCCTTVLHHSTSNSCCCRQGLAGIKHGLLVGDRCRAVVDCAAAAPVHDVSPAHMHTLSLFPFFSSFSFLALPLYHFSPLLFFSEMPHTPATASFNLSTCCLPTSCALLHVCVPLQCLTAAATHPTTCASLAVCPWGCWLAWLACRTTASASQTHSQTCSKDSPGHTRWGRGGGHTHCWRVSATTAVSCPIIW